MHQETLHETRDRIIAALNHQEPDRCPMQISFTPEFADRLRADLAMNEKSLNLCAPATIRTAAATPTSWSARWTRTCCRPPWVGQLLLPGRRPLRRRMGVTWKSHPYDTPFGTGHYTDDPTSVGRCRAPSIATSHPIRTGRSCMRTRPG